MKLHFIINPAAGQKDRAKEISEMISSELSQKDKVVHITKAPRDAERIAAEIASEEGESLIVACGGDGTLNEVVNGVAGKENVLVSCYPCGSGNDFVKSMGYGPDVSVSELVGGTERRVDLISCGDRFAINVCSVGLDASVAAHAQKIKRWPLVSGKASYTLAIPGRIIGRLGQDYTVSIDGEVLDGSYVIMVAANGVCYGGSYWPMKDADPCDGRLEFLLVRPMSHFKLPGVLAKYRRGEWQSAGDYFTRRSGSSIEITSKRRMYVNLDGEISEQTAAKFALEGVKVRFLVPKKREKC